MSWFPQTMLRGAPSHPYLTVSQPSPSSASKYQCLKLKSFLSFLFTVPVVQSFIHTAFTIYIALSSSLTFDSPVEHDW